VRVKADDPKEAAKGILARAAARGIIAGVQDKLAAVQDDHPTTKKQTQRKDTKRKSKKNMKQSEPVIERKLSPIAVRLLIRKY